MSPKVKQEGRTAKLAGVRPPLPMSVPIAARYHGVSRQLVQRWCAEGRIQHLPISGSTSRTRTILILTYERPANAAPGTLTAEQRAVRRKK